MVKKENDHDDDDTDLHYNNKSKIFNKWAVVVIPTIKSILLEKGKSTLEEKVRVAVISIIA